MTIQEANHDRQQHDPEIESSVDDDDGESIDEAETLTTMSTVDDSHDILDKMGPLSIGGPYSEVEAHALAMQQRCRELLDELEQFQAYLKQQKKETTVELRTFKGGLQAEMKLLNKLAKADPSSAKTSHGLRSSNLSFFTTVWDTAKECTSITSFGKRFYWIPGRKKSYIDGKVSTSGTAHRTNSTVVDIVAQEGLEWIKVSSKTEKRVIWDLAKAGWVGGSSDEESEDDASDDDDDPEGLLKQVEALKKASLATRVRYQHPKIRLVLPRIKSVPDSKEVRQVLQKIRDLGVTIQSADDIPTTPAPVCTVLSKMVADRFTSFSDTLNIDCTILLAFASDLSHGRVEPEDWHNKAISRQIEMESQDQLLPSSLWPACGNKQMVCTRAAAVRMQEIVAIIGTPTERRRTSIMLDSEPNEEFLTPQQRLAEFQRLSSYGTPMDWQLPIGIIDFDPADPDVDLPPVAEKVAESLTAINRSVFLFGWATHRTTISSNRAVAKEVEATIEENRGDDEDLRGPDIWLCPTSRSLVGKEKHRRGFSEAGCVNDGDSVGLDI